MIRNDKNKIWLFLLQESTFPCIITRELYFSRERLRKMTTYLTWPEIGRKYRRVRVYNDCKPVVMRN